jgi:hypothetical protein
MFIDLIYDFRMLRQFIPSAVFGQTIASRAAEKDDA